MAEDTYDTYMCRSARCVIIMPPSVIWRYIVFLEVYCLLPVSREYQPQARDEEAKWRGVSSLWCGVVSYIRRESLVVLPVGVRLMLDKGGGWGGYLRVCVCVCG